jgi:two-component system, NarL family, nitrate/nitrite response regulator NarL
MLPALTKRERQIVRLVCDRLSNKEIGRRLNISEATVKAHLHHIYQKFAIHNRIMLSQWATAEQPFESDE